MLLLFLLWERRRGSAAFVKSKMGVKRQICLYRIIIYIYNNLRKDNLSCHKLQENQMPRRRTAALVVIATEIARLLNNV